MYIIKSVGGIRLTNVTGADVKVKHGTHKYESTCMCLMIYISILL